VPDTDNRDADRDLKDFWTELSPPRRASCLAWLAFLITWLITRGITLHGKDSGKGAAIMIAGHHIHHYLMGIILLGVVSAVAIFVRPGRGWQYLGIGYGIALALIMDEYALLLNLSDVYFSRQGELSIEVVLTVIGLGAIYLTAMAWIHEGVRRSRRRARSRIATVRQRRTHS
jgi:hypothetical protein